jgi:NADH:ubiquinone oxidoreductase subunit E
MSEATAITWSGKSEAMFEIMLGEVPEAMRAIFRGKLSAVIAQKAQGGPATEDHVSAVVNEIVPDPFKTSILKKFKELGDFDIKVIDQIIQKQGTSQDRLMYILHDIQDEVGYLPAEALRAVSNKTGIHLSTVYNVATFYKTFKLTRPGSHHVKICCGTACHINDKSGIAQQIEARVGASQAVSMEKTLCMGCCDCSPAIEIDGKIYSGEDAKAKIETLA